MGRIQDAALHALEVLRGLNYPMETPLVSLKMAANGIPRNTRARSRKNYFNAPSKKRQAAVDGEKQDGVCLHKQFGCVQSTFVVHFYQRETDAINLMGRFDQWREMDAIEFFLPAQRILNTLLFLGTVDRIVMYLDTYRRQG